MYKNRSINLSDPSIIDEGRLQLGALLQEAYWLNRDAEALGLGIYCKVFADGKFSLSLYAQEEDGYMLKFEDEDVIFNQTGLVKARDNVLLASYFLKGFKAAKDRARVNNDEVEFGPLVRIAPVEESGILEDE